LPVYSFEIKTPYSAVDTTASQVYKGVNGERPEGYTAVSATIGEIVTSKGKPIDAFFFSTSGGATDAIMDIWGVKSSAYSGVFDHFENDPEKKPWIIDYSINEVSSRLSNAGYDVGTVKSIEPLILTGSDRIYRAKIKGSNGSKIISGSKLKSIFDLPDTKCRIITADSKADTVFLTEEGSVKQAKLKDCYAITASGICDLSEENQQFILIKKGNFYNIPAEMPKEGMIRFIGMGWGHGVGMSQSGAKGMAEKGYDYKQIIEFYYNNAKVSIY